MSKLIKCPSCETDVSPNAKSCPKCGSPVKKKWGFWKKFGVFWGVLIVIGIISKAGGDGSGHSAQASPTDAVAQKPAQVPAISISADQLAREYEENEVRADGKYKGKRVEITGEVASIGKDVLDDPFVVLKGEGMRDVQCGFKKSDQSKLANLSKGMNVTVEAEITGLMMNVQAEKTVLK